MHVLMLGWEFPPFISGGLGTACHGLVKALGGAGVRVTFVLPGAVAEQDESGATVMTPRRVVTTTPRLPQTSLPGLSHVQFQSVPALLPSPYGGSRPASHRVTTGSASPDTSASPLTAPVHAGPDYPADYAGDLFAHTRRYAAEVLRRCEGLAFDVIHAHDWLTWPAGMALAGVTGKPLIVHVHSTEFDRSGEHGQPGIRDIESRGCHAADRVICVSFATADLVRQRYSVPTERIRVVHNAAELPEPDGEPFDLPPRQPGERRVLFLGRITEQKGPGYFLDAAAKVLEREPNTTFIMAGAGDLAGPMIEQAARLGLGSRVRFTGFLRGADVDRIFGMVDIFVMPSVSEPFGITALEAASRGVPVIVSRSAGVSEVMRHALKVDFWDVDALANDIVGLLRHPELGQTMSSFAAREARKLTWADAADKLQRIYAELAPSA